MAVYINDRKWVPDSSRKSGGGEVINYMVDTPADIANLPDNTKIKETSTALVISTGQVKVLTESGWDKEL